MGVWREVFPCMVITDVESTAISIPLEERAAWSTDGVEQRDHAITVIRTDNDIEGVGYTLGYGGSELIADAVESLLTPIVEGEDPRDTERLWREMFDKTVQIGRKGLLLRAISTVDIALWDLRAKRAGEPMHKFLGAYRDAVPAYVTGGYYRAGKTIDDLHEEVARYVDRGHDAVKIKVGGRPVHEDETRVEAARDALGDHRTLLLDANGAWKSKHDALKACRAFARHDPYFMEEPVKPDSVALMAAVNEGLDYPVAAGELEFSRYGFEELLSRGAVDIVQPDVTVVGGVTEWLRVAYTAASYDVPVVPHYNWDLHVPLVAAIENGKWVEYFYRDSDLKVFDDALSSPLEPDENGLLDAPDEPGFGVSFDPDAIASFEM